MHHPAILTLESRRANRKRVLWQRPCRKYLQHFDNYGGNIVSCMQRCHIFPFATTVMCTIAKDAKVLLRSSSIQTLEVSAFFCNSRLVACRHGVCGNCGGGSGSGSGSGNGSCSGTGGGSGNANGCAKGNGNGNDTCYVFKSWNISNTGHTRIPERSGKLNCANGGKHKTGKKKYVCQNKYVDIFENICTANAITGLHNFGCCCLLKALHKQYGSTICYTTT